SAAAHPPTPAPMMAMSQVSSRARRVCGAARRAARKVRRVMGEYPVLWGGQSCPQPDFIRLDPLESGSAAKIGCPTVDRLLLSIFSVLEVILPGWAVAG